jgi:hypothetical protein
MKQPWNIYYHCFTVEEIMEFEEMTELKTEENKNIKEK